MTTVTREMLLHEVVEKTQCSPALAREIIGAFVDAMTAHLGKKEIVRLNKFGTFRPGERDAHLTRNPINGETVSVPHRWRVGFKASQLLRDFMNGDEDVKALFPGDEKEEII